MFMDKLMEVIFVKRMSLRFQRPELESLCYVYELHRFILFFCFVHKSLFIKCELVCF